MCGGRWGIPQRYALGRACNTEQRFYLYILPFLNNIFKEEAPRDDSQETTTDQNIDDVAIPELPKQSLSIPEPKLEHAVSAPALHVDIENVDDNTPCADTAILSPEKDNILKGTE